VAVFVAAISVVGSTDGGDGESFSESDEDKSSFTRFLALAVFIVGTAGALGTDLGSFLEGVVMRS
jgi:hypothetical protein